MTNLTARDLTVSDKAEVPDVERFITEELRFYPNMAQEMKISLRVLAARYQAALAYRDARIEALVAECATLRALVPFPLTADTQFVGFGDAKDGMPVNNKICPCNDDRSFEISGSNEGLKNLSDAILSALEPIEPSATAPLMGEGAKCMCVCYLSESLPDRMCSSFKGFENGRCQTRLADNLHCGHRQACHQGAHNDK